MNKKLFICLAALTFINMKLSSFVCTLEMPVEQRGIITSTKRIYLPKFPGAFNPSIIKFGDNYIMTFRYTPQPWDIIWVSYIGIVILDESFEPLSDGQLLDTRFNDSRTPSQCEDARIFESNGKLYLTYNDNMELENPSYDERRDMYVAELLYNNGEFSIANPLKLIYRAKLSKGNWQKNWSPFDWNGTLLFSYSLDPHDIILPNLKTGFCVNCHETNKNVSSWNYGSLRGGTTALLVDGEYLAFFHSGIMLSSVCSIEQEIWHYFAGAYTFSANPPFEVTKISSTPLLHKSYYTFTYYNKRVIYPSGFVAVGSTIYLAYGKDDCEIWIATIDLNELKKSMVPIN